MRGDQVYTPWTDDGCQQNTGFVSLERASQIRNIVAHNNSTPGLVPVLCNVRSTLSPLHIVVDTHVINVKGVVA